MRDQSAAGATHGSRLRRAAIAAVTVLGAVALLIAALYVRGGGPISGWTAPDAGPLEPSTPEETVLRTLRLAGYDLAVAAFEDSLAVVRVDVPYVRTPADVELSWQTALGAALGAWPEADRYVAQVFSDGQALVEVGVAGSDLREILATPRGTADPPRGMELEVRADVRLLYEQGASR